MHNERTLLPRLGGYDAVAARERFWFALGLALLLVLACALARPKHFGDVAEYTLMTAALADHGSPAIRFNDAATAAALLPELRNDFAMIATGIQASAAVPEAGILKGSSGAYHAIHFFTYPALAALPFQLLRAIGADPLKCFMAVNSAAVFVLGLAFFRLFGQWRRATLGVLAFLLCGGMLYWQWSSPECASAAALLAGLILFCTGAPIAGGVLAGLAAMQNPPIILFCAFAPMLSTALAGGATARTLPRPRELAGLAACAALFALPLLYNLAVFGTPSIVGRSSTDLALVTPNRLHSFFLDLNQGLLIGVPALAAGLLWRARRSAGLTRAACAFTIAMALPCLAAQNWNSGTAGIMRYALWTSMPLLFAFACQLKIAPRWPSALLLMVLVGQLLAMANARRYDERGFSPLAQRAMALAPAWYNPDPEIFYERTEGHESFPDQGKVFRWPADGQALKTLYHIHNPDAARQLCGAGGALAPDNRTAGADRGWRYINGPVRCTRPGY
jgi:hypothetical protein